MKSLFYDYKLDFDLKFLKNQHVSAKNRFLKNVKYFFFTKKLIFLSSFT